MEIHARSVQFRIYVYFIVLGLYLAFGTIIFYNIGANKFQMLEHDASIERREIFATRCLATKNEAINDLENEIKILENNNSLKDSNINAYSVNSPLHKNILKLLEKIDECHRNHNITNVKEINFYNAFSFVYSVTATLGYGDIEAQTTQGKIFFILFSMISIPLFIAFYVDLTESFVGEVIETYYNTKLLFKNLGCLNRQKQIHYKKEIEIQKRKQLPKVVVSMACLVTIFFICSFNHFYQVKDVEEDETMLTSMSFVFESIALIGLGNNVPENTFAYLTKELPLLFIGVCFFGIYLNSTVNIARHMIPTVLNKYRKNKNDDNSFDILDYILYQPKNKNLGILGDYRSDSYMYHINRTLP
uniref:Ion_trans_2 domain-containing protein n=1 Tax=Strongyloides papillosus TaxID=174720 RepID=A0A0N5BDY7_STREA